MKSIKLRFTGVLQGLEVVLLLSLLAGCAGQPGSPTGDPATVNATRIDSRRLSEAIRAMGIEELPAPEATAEVELPEAIVAGEMGLSSPAGFRYRRGQNEGNGGTLEFISGRRGITGAASIVRGIVEVELYVQTLAATIIRRQESPRFFLRNDAGSAVVFFYEGEAGLEMLGIAEFQGYIGALAWSFSGGDSEPGADYIGEFLAMLKSMEPSSEGRYARFQRGLGGRLAANLDSLRWIADVDGGGMVLEDTEEDSLAIISAVDPRQLPDFAGFRFAEGAFPGAPSVGGAPVAAAMY